MIIFLVCLFATIVLFPVIPFYIHKTNLKERYDDSTVLNATYLEWLNNRKAQRPSKRLFTELYNIYSGKNTLPHTIAEQVGGGIYTSTLDLIENFPSRHKEISDIHVKILLNMQDSFQYDYEQSCKKRYIFHFLWALPTTIIKAIGLDAVLKGLLNAFIWLFYPIAAYLQKLLVDFIISIITKK